MRILAIGLGALAALSACAPTDGGVGSPPSTASRSPARQCFDVRQVNNFRQGTPGQVFLKAARNDVFEAQAAGGCLDLDFANRLAITPDFTGAASGRVCVGDWARVVVPGSTSPSSFCRVRIARRLTAEEVAALPDRMRP